MKEYKEIIDMVDEVFNNTCDSIDQMTEDEINERIKEICKKDKSHIKELSKNE